MFRGITVCSHTPNPEEVRETLLALPMPELKSFRAISNPMREFVWEVKPPGQWAHITRYDEMLVTGNPNIPLDVDYEHLYKMLAAHKSTLLARLDPVVGLIAVAVRRTNEPFTPLLPGYFAVTRANATLLNATGVETLSEQGHDWPEGLQKPSLIGMQAATSLANPEHRADWLRKSPEGIWLLAVEKQQLAIYEVL